MQSPPNPKERLKLNRLAKLSGRSYMWIYAAMRYPKDPLQKKCGRISLFELDQWIERNPEFKMSMSRKQARTRTRLNPQSRCADKLGESSVMRDLQTA